MRRAIARVECRNITSGYRHCLKWPPFPNMLRPSVEVIPSHSHRAQSALPSSHTYLNTVRKLMKNIPPALLATIIIGIVLGFAAITAALYFTSVEVQSVASEVHKERERVEARKERADIAIAPAPTHQVAAQPLPTETPFVGKDGTREDGVSTKTADKAALRALLMAEKFDLLSESVDAYHTEAASDPGKEMWAIDAFFAFAVADRAMLPKLNAWAKAKPDTFAPLMARGAHHYKLGRRARGGMVMGETTEKQMEAMRDHYKRAKVDLLAALEIQPAAVGVHAVLIDMARTGESKEALSAAQKNALGAHPASYAVHQKIVMSALPKWGGSKKELNAALAAADNHTKDNPALKMLPAELVLEECRIELQADRFASALPLCDKAVAAAPNLSTAHRKKAYTHMRLKEYGKAIESLKKTLALHPGDLTAMGYLADAYTYNNQFAEAGEYAVKALDIDPTYSRGPFWLKELAPRVVQVAQRRYQDHKDAEALRIYNLALRLSPGNKKALQWRTLVLPDPASEEALKAASAKPDDFALRVRVDKTLAPKGRFRDIVDSWTAYLKLKPNDARAYHERGGAYFSTGQWQEALNDATRACDGGVEEACRVKPMIQQRAAAAKKKG